MPAVQYWFTATALATFLALLAALSTLGYGWYRAAITEQESAQSKAYSDEQKEKGQQAKQLLGRFLESGNRLLSETSSKPDAQAKGDAEAWATQARDLIAAAYGDGEAALFANNSGYTFFSDGSEKTTIRNWIDGRMRRLGELLRRTDTLAVRSDFDPTQFQTIK